MEISQFQQSLINQTTFDLAKNQILSIAPFIERFHNQKQKIVEVKIGTLCIIIETIGEVITQKDIFCYDYSVKFEILRQFQQHADKIGKPIGIKLLKEFYETRSFYTSDKQLILNWKLLLQNRINQQGFHKLFKPLKKMYRDQYMTTYHAQRLQDDSNVIIQAYSKQLILAKKNGQNKIINQIIVFRKIYNSENKNLVEVFESDNSIYLVFEWFNGDPFEKMLKKSNITTMNVKLIIKNLFQALNNLHKIGISHRNLNLKNIIVQKQTQKIKILSFVNSIIYVVDHNQSQNNQNKLVFDQNKKIDLRNIIQISLRLIALNTSHINKQNYNHNEHIQNLFFNFLIDQYQSDEPSIQQILNHYYFKSLQQNHLPICNSSSNNISSKQRQLICAPFIQKQEICNRKIKDNEIWSINKFKLRKSKFNRRRLSFDNVIEENLQ